jgi:hypothetical protein
MYKRTEFYMLGIILFFGLILWYSEYTEPNRKLECFHSILIEGVVLRKYLDSTDHHYEKVVIENLSVNCNFVSEKSRIYFFIEKGDSLYKPLNSTTISVYRKGVYKRNFDISF